MHSPPFLVRWLTSV